MSRLALGPTKVPGALTLGIKGLWHEAAQSLASMAVITNGVCGCVGTHMQAKPLRPLYAFMACKEIVLLSHLQEKTWERRKHITKFCCRM